ncbi:MAG TPA: alpha/beta fold hydrolase [Solirubrobacteraceae bacterium]|jgi:pimeloyl-ACP methyl ester carboxylesterase|nr:alpha/beta fold hydrolase [Solirubrobacteraceae bacterium]
MASFRHDGHRLAYRVYEPATPAVRRPGPAGSNRPLILVHGLLLSQRMHMPLARDLAAHGNRVITIDLLGHGSSDRPRDMWRYSMEIFAGQVVALMDHLELEQAVVGGTSLGANATLEVAARAPVRLRGMLVEMPVLDNALLACAVAFTPLLISLTFGEPIMRLVSRLTRAVPSRLLPFYADVALDTVRQDPAPSAAVLQGLFFGRVAPPRSERRTFNSPALVIGHHRDPVHPFSDAGMLVDELGDARLVEADSLIELRFSPERLTNEIAEFLDQCWEGRPNVDERGRAGRPSAGQPRAAAPASASERGAAAASRPATRSAATGRRSPRSRRAAGG